MSSAAVVDTATTTLVLAVSPPSVSGNTLPSDQAVKVEPEAEPKVEVDDSSDFELIDGTQETQTSVGDDEGDSGDDSSDSSSTDFDDDVGVVRELYDEPPSRMNMAPEVISETYYAVYVGRRVSITTESSIAMALMTKLPGGSQKSFKTQEGAVAAFNKALAVPGAVRVAYQ